MPISIEVRDGRFIVTGLVCKKCGATQTHSFELSGLTGGRDEGQRDLDQRGTCPECGEPWILKAQAEFQAQHMSAAAAAALASHQDGAGATDPIYEGLCRLGAPSPTAEQRRRRLPWRRQGKP